MNVTSANAYFIGALVRVTGTFTDVNLTLVDPTIVRFKYRKGGSSTTVTLVYGVDITLVRSGVGVYYVDLNADTAGTWPYRWESATTYQAACEGQFNVLGTLV